MTNRYKDAFRRLSGGMSRIADEYGISHIRLYWDAAKCYVRYGVTPNEYLGWRFYELSALERGQFYSARDSKKWERRFNNPAHADEFNQKQETNRVFKDFISRAWLYTKESSESEIKQFLNTFPKVIVKPVGLSSGRGIHVACNEDIKSLANGEFLLEEFIVQDSRMASLNESSVNSVRVYTMSVDKDRAYCNGNTLQMDDVLFLSASIRVGGVKSEVDNYHAGGVGYPLDICSGVVCGPGTTISGEKVLFHPGSNVKVIGFEVPNWQKLKEFIVRLDHVVPDARLIAWDIAVIKDGFELIEANYDGDPGFMQAPTQTGKRKVIIKNF
ncbi:MAG: sugar-transfer associated ATP-grasp domain-containing protein [Muribaculaceae bacterium]